MYIALSLLACILIGIVLLIGGFVSIYRARRSAAPFYPAPADAIRKALKGANLRRGERFYDLGAGTGKALLIAEKEFGADAMGFELSQGAYWIAKINLFLHRSKTRIVRANLFDQDLGDADVIFCFLAIRTMQKIEDKLKAGLKPGTRIVSYAFPFPDWTPIKTIPIRGNWNIYIYHFPPL